ncbi:MAG: acyl-CoA thioesterase/bile acid-CoA:amino acid N-acyltransferase family protein [Pseudomonadota bacterium]
MSNAAAQQIELTQDEFAFDDPPNLRVTGLKPNSLTIVTVNVNDAGDTDWFGQSVYIADAAGTVDPAKQAPQRGMYKGVHASGPFWSLVGGQRFDTSGDAEGKISVSSLSGELIVERSFRWQSPQNSPNIARTDLSIPDLAVSLYLPHTAKKPAPTVILFGGSGGGSNEERASQLARHGYAVLDTAYFGTEGAPRYFLETIPVERFSAVIDYVESDPRLDSERVIVMGRSYGAQLALVLSVYDQRIAGVIAEVPSNIVSGAPSSYPYGETLSAWSFGGQALPFATENESSKELSTIAVEKFSGPLLLISGGADKVWPSGDMAKQIVQRRNQSGLGEMTRHVYFPAAGHNFGGGEQSYGVPYLPPKDRQGRSGGDKAANSIAAIAAWKETLDFLKMIAE